MNNKLKRTKL